MRDDQTLEKHVVSVVWLWGVGRELGYSCINVQLYEKRSLTDRDTAGTRQRELRAQTDRDTHTETLCLQS